MVDNPFAASRSEKPIWKMPERKVNVEEPKQEIKPESEHAQILREHGGIESNIPINHRYWRIRP